MPDDLLLGAAKGGQPEDGVQGGERAGADVALASSGDSDAGARQAAIPRFGKQEMARSESIPDSTPAYIGTLQQDVTSSIFATVPDEYFLLTWPRRLLRASHRVSHHVKQQLDSFSTRSRRGSGTSVPFAGKIRGMTDYGTSYSKP